MVRIITCAVYVDSDDDEESEDNLQVLLLKNGMMARVFDNDSAEDMYSFKQEFEYYKKIYME